MKNKHTLALDVALFEIDRYSGKMLGILMDFLSGSDAMQKALEAQLLELRSTIEDLATHDEGSDKEDSFEITAGVDVITEHLKELAMDGNQLSKLFEIVLGQDEDIIFSCLKDEGYAFVKLDSPAEKMKLEEFVTSEIYPHYNDSNKFSI